MKRLLVVSVGLAALMVGVVVAWYAVRQEREFQRLIAAGDAALAQDQTSSAIEAFSGALALKRDSMLAHLKRGDTYRRRGELTAALRDLREAARARPVRAPPGGAARRRQRRAWATTSAPPSTTARSPSSTTARRACSTSWPRVLPQRPDGGRDRAAAACDRDSTTDSPKHITCSPCAFANDRRQRSGLRALTRAVEINPAFVAAREELADLYRTAGQRQQAIEQLEALAALEPARAERLISVGLAYARWGRTESAILTLGRAAERFPDQTAAISRSARVAGYRRESKRSRRVEQSDRGAAAACDERRTRSGDALTWYGRAMLLSGDAARRRSALFRATSRAPVDPLALRHLADAPSGSDTLRQRATRWSATPRSSTTAISTPRSTTAWRDWNSGWDVAR